MTGKVPFEGTSEQRVFGLVAYERKVPPRPYSGMHDALWDIVNLCWAREAPQRPQITRVKHCLRGLFEPLFRTPLVLQLVRDGTDQPKILTKLAGAIEKHAVNRVGIYRANGREGRARELRKLLEQGRSFPHTYQFG